MNYNEFIKILTAFADTPTNIDVEHGELIVQIRDDLIVAKVFNRHGELFVEEDGGTLPASAWIVNRIARLPILADRILSQIDDEPHFINPSGTLLDRIDRAPDDREQDILDMEREITSLLAERPGGTSTGLYITSDAGEGKTTLIHHLARRQASLYRKKETDWLIVPISLGGRTFLRFDDVIIGTLVNTLRFPFLYYEAFVWLVRLGVIVPALDGFEEMFVEGQAGDAISALGNLMDMLNSQGTVLIAARKAYFEYKGLEVQAPLFDSIRDQSAEFARLHLHRWNRTQFVEYAMKRRIGDGAALFDEAADKLGPEHPLLTRAVLVRRLMDLAEDQARRHDLIESIRTDKEGYFDQFVESIMAREANEKWIDKSGDPARPLMAVLQHRVLLAEVAHEMWICETSALRAEVLESVVDMYAESNAMTTSTTNQIRERVKQHALIVESDTTQRSFRFDHDEFYHFFLGEAISIMMLGQDLAGLRYTFGIGRLPALTVDSAARRFTRNGGTPNQLISTMNDVCETEPHASFVRENAGTLVIRAVTGLGVDERMAVRRLAFPVDALRAVKIRDIDFFDCSFQRTDLVDTRMVDCNFERCQFGEIDLSDLSSVTRTMFNRCDFFSVVKSSNETATFAPALINAVLQRAGFGVYSEAMNEETDPDIETIRSEQLAIAERFFRTFYRSTGINEDALRHRLGRSAGLFFDEVLPALLQRHVLKEVQYVGSGQQRRFRLNVSLGGVQEAIERSNGNFDRFLGHVAQTPGPG